MATIGPNRREISKKINLCFNGTHVIQLEHCENEKHNTDLLYPSAKRLQMSVESAILSKLLRNWLNHAVAGPAVKTRTARPTDDMFQMNCFKSEIRLVTVHGKLD